MIEVQGIIVIADRKWGYRPVHHVFELVFLVVAVLVGLPVALGAVPAPQTTASFLQPGLLAVWGWMLLVGAGIALLGLLWAGRVVSGLVIEQVGLIVLAGAVALYVAGAAVNVQLAAAVPIAIVGAFGLACALRSVQLRQEIRDLVKASVTQHSGETGEQEMRDHLQRVDERESEDSG